MLGVSADDPARRLAAFRRDVMRVLPGRVRDVVLFGSRARGDAGPRSDWDVAVILAPGCFADDGTRETVSDPEMDSWELAVPFLSEGDRSHAESRVRCASVVGLPFRRTPLR